MQLTKEGKNIVQSLINLVYDEDALSKYLNNPRCRVRLFDSNKIDADFRRTIPTPDGRCITQIAVDFKQIELELFSLKCHAIDKGFHWMITIMGEKEISFIRDSFYETLERECSKIKISDCTGSQLYNKIKDRIAMCNAGSYCFQKMLGFDPPDTLEDFDDKHPQCCLFETQSANDGREVAKTGVRWGAIYITATEMLKSYVGEKV